MPSTTSWVTLAYEVKMFSFLLVTNDNPAAAATAIIKGPPSAAVPASDAAVITAATSLLSSTFIGNAIAESAVLHARILCDLFSSEDKSYPDDIGFSDLFEDWETGARYRNLKSHIAEMKAAYLGDYQTKKSPCRQFNKKLAHLTKERGLSHSHEEAVGVMEPLIRKIVSELESLKPGFPDKM